MYAIKHAKLRDTRKPASYFSKYLANQHNRISSKMAKLDESVGDKRQRILVSLTGMCCNMLKAEYSAGASIKDLKNQLISVLDIVGEYKNMTKDDLLVLLSLASLLGCGKYITKIVSSNEITIHKDRLLNYIADTCIGNAVWDPMLKLDTEYKGLDNVFTSDDKIDAMKKYLLGWYSNHSGYAWYNNHNSSEDTYCGYWSFESAVIVRSLHIDDSTLLKIDIYPDMK